MHAGTAAVSLVYFAIVATASVVNRDWVYLIHSFPRALVPSFPSPEDTR